jgi:hypothetical protein
MFNYPSPSTHPVCESKIGIDVPCSMYLIVLVGYYNYRVRRCHVFFTLLFLYCGFDSSRDLQTKRQAAEGGLLTCVIYLRRPTCEHIPLSVNVGSSHFLQHNERNLAVRMMSVIMSDNFVHQLIYIFHLLLKIAIINVNFRDI